MIKYIRLSATDGSKVIFYVSLCVLLINSIRLIFISIFDECKSSKQDKHLSFLCGLFSRMLVLVNFKNNSSWRSTI